MNNFKEELDRYEQKMGEVCNKLNFYEENGVFQEEIEDFNFLCKEEFELKVKINTLKCVVYGGTVSINTAPISRKIKIIPSNIIKSEESLPI